MRDLLSPPLAFCAHRTACCRCFCCFDLPGPLLVCPRCARVSHSAPAAFCVHAAVSMMQRREQHAPPRRHAVADADHARRERGAGTALLPRSLLVCHLTPLTRSLRQPGPSVEGGRQDRAARPGDEPDRHHHDQLDLGARQVARGREGLRLARRQVPPRHRVPLRPRWLALRRW